MVRVQTSEGGGTGFIFETTVGGGAYVLTNHHVVDSASQVSVWANDASSYSAKVLGYDAYRDLAVLEICCGSFRSLDFEDSSGLKSGNEVIAIGYALSYSGAATVTQGIVSAVRWDSDHSAWVIQTDAPINPGNSGGPLLLPTGEVIGINTFTQDWTSSGRPVDGVGFAVSEQSIRGILQGLKQGSRVGLPTPMSTPSPTPTSTIVPVRWQTYTNYNYGYSINVPKDWSVDDSDQSHLIFDSPNDEAGVSVAAYNYPADLEDWVSLIIESEEDEYPRSFEIFSQRVDQNVDGTGTGFIILIGQSSSMYCVEHIKYSLVVTNWRSYYLRSVICELAINSYAEIERSILFGGFKLGP